MPEQELDGDLIFSGWIYDYLLLHRQRSGEAPPDRGICVDSGEKTPLL